MFKVAICDDDKDIANSIEDCINRLLLSYNHWNFQVDVFYDGRELKNHLQLVKYDICFLDIYMQGVDGIHIAQKIRETDQNAIIVFISSYKSYFEKLFDVQPFNFIHKPIDWDKFKITFEKAIKKISDGASYFLFTCDRTTIRILIDDIVVLETYDRKIILTTISETYSLNGTLKEIYDQISNNNFIYVSQSAFVNMKHVVKIFPEYIVFTTGQKIFISRRKQSQVREVFKRLWQEDIVNAGTF